MAYIRFALNKHMLEIAATQFTTLDACILFFVVKKLHLKLIPNQLANEAIDIQGTENSPSP